MSYGNKRFFNDSESSSNTTYSDGHFLLLLGLAVPLYVIVFTFALVGNIFALLTCYKNYRVTTSIFLIYIASLASADLLFVLLTLFHAISFLLGDWIGESFCKIVGFLTETSYSASILTLVAISYERFRGISSKHLARSRRIETRAIIVKMVWVVSVVLCAPLLYGYDTTINKKSGKLDCVNHSIWGVKGRQIYYALQTIALFLLPVGVMIWAHFSIFRLLRSHSRDSRGTLSVSRNQRKTTKMLAAVTLVFFFCWTPFITWRALNYFVFPDYEEEIIWKFCQLLIILNSGINPILYNIFSEQFRSSFKEFMRCNCKQASRRSSLEPGFGSATQDSEKISARSPSSPTPSRIFQNLSRLSFIDSSSL